MEGVSKEVPADTISAQVDADRPPKSEKETDMPVKTNSKKKPAVAIIDPEETKSSMCKRSATIAVGLFEIFIVVGKVAYFEIFTRRTLQENGVDLFEIQGLVLIGGFLTVLIFVLLIIGAILRNSWLFMPYMVGQFFILGLNFYAAFDAISGTVQNDGMKMYQSIFVLAMVIVIVFAKIVCWGIAFSYYRVVVNRTL